MVGRLNKRYCFFAVKKDVNKITREDFKIPKKDDEYSTSVLGIQFTRNGICTVEIISRYNHTVPNPNCTLGNNLDKLAPGLEQSFGNLLLERGLKLNSTIKKKFEIPGYTVANDEKYYKYNMEINGDYYCPGNIAVLGGKAIKVANPEEGLLIDYFYIDKKRKTIKACNGIDDSFVDDLQGIERIEVVKSDEEENINRVIKIYIQDVEEPVLIGIDKNNQIIKYENKNITNIGDHFLKNNEGLIKLELPNVQNVGDYFLLSNKGLTELELPNLEQVGDNFLFSNKRLTELKLQSLKQVGDNFLFSNNGLTKLILSNLEKIGDHFLRYNEVLTKLELPNLQNVGDYFLLVNRELTKLELPNLKRVGVNFLVSNRGLTKLEAPNLKQVGGCFLKWNRGLTRLELPSLEKVGNDFLMFNMGLKNVKLLNLKEVPKKIRGCDSEGYDFLPYNKELVELEVPNLPELKEQLLYIISNNLKKQRDRNLKILNSKSITKLDIDNKLTTPEMSKVQDILKKEEENER